MLQEHPEKPPRPEAGSLAAHAGVDDPSGRGLHLTGFEDLIEGLELPDPNDRHVLAAAILAGAQAIITLNLGDFPDGKLAPYNVEAKHPDDFVLDAIDLAPGLVTTALLCRPSGLRNPPRTVGELLDILRDQGLVRSVAKLRELFGAADPLS